MKVLILYFTKTGHTLEAVNATAEGIRSAGSQVDVVSAGDFSADRLTGHGVLLVGSPCWWGSVAGGVATPVQRALAALTPDALNGKTGAAISVGAFAGADKTVASIGTTLADKGCTDFRPGPTARAGLPLSVAKGPSVTAEDEERFKAFGAKLVS
jgi:menaquinone-dependent protoporphyrinogen IX oxidase